VHGDAELERRRVRLSDRGEKATNAMTTELR
jgi:hypothetical protein